MFNAPRYRWLTFYITPKSKHLSATCCIFLNYNNKNHRWQDCALLVAGRSSLSNKLRGLFCFVAVGVRRPGKSQLERHVATYYHRENGVSCFSRAQRKHNAKRDSRILYISHTRGLGFASENRPFGFSNYIRCV